MGKVDDSVIPTLLTAIGNKDKTTAKAAGRVLSAIAPTKSDKVLPGLTELLDKDQEPGVSNALKVLRFMKAAAAPALPKISSLYDKSDAHVRLEILGALSSIDSKGDQALPVLVKALKAHDIMVRKEALLGVIRYRTKVDVFLEPLTESMKEGDLENRLLAIGIVRGLGQQGLKAVPTLTALTDDPNVRVRSSAIGVLATFRPPPEDVLETFGRKLKDSQPAVRLAAVGALRQIGYVYPEKVTGLLESALKDEKNELTRRAMAATLAGIRKVKPSTTAAKSTTPDKAKPSTAAAESTKADEVQPKSNK